MKHQIMTVMLDAFLIINALPPQFLQKRFPYFFHGAFAPSFIWCRRPWMSLESDSKTVLLVDCFCQWTLSFHFRHSLHPCVSPATPVSIPARFPRNPRDFRHPHCAASPIQRAPNSDKTGHLVHIQQKYIILSFLLFLIMDARSAMRPCYILPMFFYLFLCAP